jgi:predicted deacylase
MKTTVQPLKIHQKIVEPGQRAIINIPMPGLYNASPMIMPVHVLHSHLPGPCLLVTAAIHGDEINGVEIIRRLLKLRALKSLRGTLLAVPVANVYGFVSRSRYLMDRRDLNRSFPGSDRGSLASRLASMILQELVSKCTHIIDLHTGSLHRSNLPQVRITLEDPEMVQLAQAFHAPVILNTRSPDGSLRQAAKNLGISTLLYEAGEALRFEETAIRIGMQGIVNVMRTLKMLAPNTKEIKSRYTPAIAQASLWVRASRSGIIRPSSALGQYTTKGDSLGVIADPLGQDETEVIAPIDGIIIGFNNLPMVHEGDALFHIGSFETFATTTESTKPMVDPDIPSPDNEFTINNNSS